MEDAHRLGLALERRGLELIEREPRAGRLVGRLADGDPHLWRHGLDARGGVDRVAREEPLPGARDNAQPDERLAGVDPDPKSEWCAADARESLGFFGDPQGRPDRALGVVLVGRRDAEHADDRIADELLDHAPVGLDRRPGEGEVRREHSVDVFGVRRFRGRREPHEVAEQGGDDLALLGHRGGDGRAERRTA